MIAGPDHSEAEFGDEMYVCRKSSRSSNSSSPDAPVLPEWHKAQANAYADTDVDSTPRNECADVDDKSPIKAQRPHLSKHNLCSMDIDSRSGDGNSGPELRDELSPRELGSPEETLAMKFQSAEELPEQELTFASRRKRTEPAARLRPMSLVLVSDRLELLVAPGDVFCTKGRGRLMEIGRAGGFMGHVMVVVGQPRSILRNSPEACQFFDCWPADVSEVWMIRTIECTSKEPGLFEVDSLFYVRRDIGELMVWGEVQHDGEIVLTSPHEPIEVFQSPSELRAELRCDLMVDVVKDMHATLGNWSAATAARAIVRQGSQVLSGGNRKVLRDMSSCWSKEPICTSVVIIFWQMYLCRFAAAINATRPEAHRIDPADMIRRFMPLKADRVLPGSLLKSMRENGFVVVAQVPKIFKSVLLTDIQHVPPMQQMQPLAAAQEHVPPMQQMQPPAAAQEHVGSHQHCAAIATARQQHLAEPPFGIGERVCYWSESRAQWLDAVVMRQHLDSRGFVAGYDLDIKEMADASRIRRNPQCVRQPLAPHGVPHSEGGISLQRGDAAALSALIAAAMNEGWFSSDNINQAVGVSKHGVAGKDDAISSLRSL
jgi:hypothetical protein